MQEGDRGESDSRQGGRDNGTIPGMTGRKEARKKRTTEKVAGVKSTTR